MALKLKLKMKGISKIIKGAFFFAIGLTLGILPKSKFKKAIRYSIVRLIKEAPLRIMLGKGDTVVQVGAVVKGDIFPMAKIVGSSGRVIAVEPHPDNIKAIKDRLREKSIKNVVLIAKGAWSKKGKQTLLVHPDNLACSRIALTGIEHDRYLTPEEYKQTMDIEVDTLDNILAELGVQNVDLIKITVAGVELEVLGGMQSILETSKQLWIKAHSIKDGQPVNRIIAARLAKNNFKVIVMKRTATSDGLKRLGDVYAIHNC